MFQLVEIDCQWFFVNDIVVCFEGVDDIVGMQEVWCCDDDCVWFLFIEKLIEIGSQIGCDVVGVWFVDGVGGFIQLVGVVVVQCYDFMFVGIVLCDGIVEYFVL